MQMPHFLKRVFRTKKSSGAASGRNFSHVANVTDYMKIVVHIVQVHFPDLSDRKILHLPAGNGWIGDQLRNHNAQVIDADINQVRPDFLYVNMEQPLPFADNNFDVIICTEGIEHIFSPFHLFAEFARCLKRSGMLIISTPNVQNLYSRYQLLCTGYPFQFNPFTRRPRAENADKGHISPVFYTQLHYYAEHFGMRIAEPAGDRIKRKILIPLLLPFVAIGYWWANRDRIRASNDKNQTQIIRHLFNFHVLLSRSLIFIAFK